MNILHLVSYAVYSGPLPPTLVLARAQQALGHNVWLAHDTLRGAFSPFEEGADKPVEQSGVMLPSRPLGLSPKRGLRQLMRDRTTLRRLTVDLALDVVHSHLSHDHALVALAGLKTLTARRHVRRVHTIHATRQLSLWPHRRWLWRHTDGVVVRSAADFEAFRRIVGPKSIGAVGIVPSAIDIEQWSSRPNDARSSAYSKPEALSTLPGNAPLLVHVALMASRGQRELLEAFSLFLQELRDDAGHKPPQELPHLAFVGDGPCRVALEQRTQSLGLTHLVHFVGYVQAPTLRAIYERADGAFVAQPGNDAGARAALEALALGVPLIAVSQRRNDALAELAADGRAQLLFERTVPTLRAALWQWYTHQRFDKRSSDAAGRWLAETRSPEREAMATLALYKQSLARA